MVQAVKLYAWSYQSNQVNDGKKLSPLKKKRKAITFFSWSSLAECFKIFRKRWTIAYPWAEVESCKNAKRVKQWMNWFKHLYIAPKVSFWSQMAYENR